MAALTEFALIDRFFRRPARTAVLGVGDDAALLAPTPGWELAVAVDMLVASRHFFADVDPESLGHKALAVNLSDMAAMGARPRWALLAGALPDANADWLAAFARGFYALADAHRVELIGGDTTKGPLNLCVTILGEVPAGQALRRSGAMLGDDIWVSGPLGDAALALAHQLGRVELDADEWTRCRSVLLRPMPRVALGERLRGVASSAIDISDGLIGDLGHILEASAAGAIVEMTQVPRSAALARRLRSHASELALSCLLAGGDDYELCFTAASARVGDVRMIGDVLGLNMQRIGVIVAQPGLIVRNETGEPMTKLPHGFDHFAS